MDYLREVRRTASRLGVGYASFLLAGVLPEIEAGLVIALMINRGWKIDINTYLMLLGALPMYFIGTLVCWLIVKDMETPCKPEKQKFTAGQLAFCFLVCISVMNIGNIAGNGLMASVNGLLGRPLVNPVSQLVKGLNVWVIFLIMVVAAPVFEEFLYRKLLIDRVAQYGDRTAIILSGILFGLSHGNFYQFFYAFGLGVIFAYIYINTGKLRYTVALHAIINFLGSIAALYAENHTRFRIAYLSFMIAGAVLGIVFLILYRHHIRFKSAMVEIPKGKRFSVLFLNLGMILFFCVSGGLFMTG